MSIALNVITGFLGSGKTTLLKRLLQGESLGDTALLINEFGDVGIDHLLVEEVAPDTVLLPGGCVCCSIRGELKDALLGLLQRRERGEIPAFKRVILETTGLADPAPILATLNNDVQLRGRFHIGLVITLVDASHATLQERLHPEWLAQVAAADRLLLSKPTWRAIVQPCVRICRHSMPARRSLIPMRFTAAINCCSAKVCAATNRPWKSAAGNCIKPPQPPTVRRKCAA